MFLRGKTVNIPNKSWSWYVMLPWLFLVIALPASYFVWQESRALEYGEKKSNFEQSINQSIYDFSNHITPFEEALYGVRSLFEASSFVEESEFRLYVSELFSRDLLESLNEIGFAKLVNPIESKSYSALEPKYLKQMLSFDQKTLHAPVIYTDSHRHEHTSPVYDAFENSALKTAMLQAAQYNQVVMSEPIGGPKSHHSLFSLLLPVYDSVKTKQGGASVMRDYSANYGWAFVNVDLRPIFDVVFNSRGADGIHYALYTSDGNSLGKLLYENVADQGHKSLFSTQKKISLYGHSWVLVADTLPEFEDSIGYTTSNTVAIASILASTGLAIILFLLMARVRAFDQIEQVNQRLTLSDERWRFALEGSESGVWDWNILNNKIEYSLGWKNIFGFDDDTLQGTYEEWISLIHPEDRKRVTKILDAYLEGVYESYSIEYRFRCHDDSWKWVLSKGMVVKRGVSGEPERMVGTNTDVTKKKLVDEQIWQEANLDYLTSLPNRRMLHSRLEQWVVKSKKQAQHFALLCLDLDNFKEVNETLGHVQGDMLLRQAATRLTECAQQAELIARLGGDEFVLVVHVNEQSCKTNIEKIAQAVLQTLSQPFHLKDEVAYISASIGVTIFPDHAGDIEGLLQHVDQAMYASKQKGGNCYTYFTQEMQEKAVQRMRLASDLRVALQNQELFVQYQPIIELSTGDVFKAEALLRWQHKEKGLISPIEFIPIAEDTKLINEIGNWVFLEAIRNGEYWQKSHDARFQVAVNKSAVQFMSADPAHAQWLQQLSLSGNRVNPIVVEITESILLENSSNVVNRLKDYRQRGIKIALDDFGTGYSSLSYLRKFDIDYLKIDRSFVANMENSDQDILLCKSIIKMAHSLGIKVVAEGIETEKQRQILCAAGCDYGQGYYFSKPLTGADFDVFLETQKAKKTNKALEVA